MMMCALFQTLCFSVTSDNDFVRVSCFNELGLCGVKSVPGEVFLSRNQRFTRREIEVQIETLSSESFFRGVSEKETQLCVDEDDDIEALVRLGTKTRVVLGGGQIPESLDFAEIGVHRFVAFLLTEEARASVELDRG